MRRASTAAAAGVMILLAMSLTARGASPIAEPIAEVIADRDGRAEGLSERLISSGRVRLRVRIDPEGEILLGQQTRLLIEILTDTWFSSAPRYPELNLPGAITLLPQQMGTNFTEPIAGVTFAGQRRGYVIFPERVGKLEIPPIDISLGISSEGRDTERFILTTKAETLQVVAPSGMENADGLFTTSRLVVSDEWNGTLDSLRVGDAIERTVRLKADQTLGMLLPDIVFEAPPGIAAYEDQARVLDHVHRGQFGGERVEKVTYVLQKGGHLELPPIEIEWWDTGLGELRTEVLEAPVLEVSGIGDGHPLGGVATNAGERSRVLIERIAAWVARHWVLWLGIGIVVVAGLRLWGGALARGRIALAAIAERQRNSEPRAVRAFDRSLRHTADPDWHNEIVQRYWLWRDRFRTTHPVLSESVWRQASDESGFTDHWIGFEASHYGSATETIEMPDATRIRHDLRRFRASLRSSSRRRTTQLASTELNPRQATANPMR